MVKIEYTIKIKDTQNPPEIYKGMGKGVISKITIEYKEVDEEELQNNVFIRKGIVDQMDKLIAEHFEVIPKIIK